MPNNQLAKEMLRNSRATLLFQTADICILEGTDQSIAHELLQGSPGWTRIFEEYYLAPANDDTAKGSIVGAFFNWLSDRYTDEIDLSRNLACYEELYRIAHDFRDGDNPPAVLDVGCGPGTIMRTHIPQSAQTVVGYDISDVTSRAAVSHGMTVMPRAQFLSQEPRFDVALSAYAMHYACDLPETLSGVQRNLKSQGIWVLNFHKNIGIELFLARLPTTHLHLVASPYESPFGAIVIVRNR
ncbi:hypothetical protein CE206_00665 [Achromobacter xylosoxidans]|uniref:class I SAM-dependent methyltransferase n=1 Tax=Alcaligenes xylosoxydans xylosoxydans TaxID=85698 RepID=UPI000DD12AD5|nr:class I SAM-dependent methyltransferase [Achromobacter xylosoxidans]AXA75060.1 hypothetical protein CE206_00665 [Achromobacter xylosoxidans]